MRSWVQGLHRGDHILHTFYSQADQERTAIEVFRWTPEDARMYFFTSGPEAIMRAPQEGDLKDRMQAAQVEGRLRVHLAGESYCPNGHFHYLPMLGEVVRAVEQAKNDGYRSMVAVGDAGWLATRREEINEFIKYEAGLNILDFPMDVTFVCQYDGRLFHRHDLDRLRPLHDKVLMDRTLERNHWIISHHREFRHPPQ
jgi:hypothetical protein